MKYTYNSLHNCAQTMNSSVCVGSRANANLRTALFWAITNYQYSLRNNPVIIYFVVEA